MPADSKSYAILNSSINIVNNTINSTNYYGNNNIVCFNCNSSITNFTNNGIILGGGGSPAVSSGPGNDGASAFTNNNTITNFYNYLGAFLGGGGAGGTSPTINEYGIRGGAGGGGGGIKQLSTSSYSGGSLINSTTNATNIALAGTEAGCGGGPGGYGGSSYNSLNSSITAGGTGGRSLGGKGGGGPNNDTTTTAKGVDSLTNIYSFTYGGGGGAAFSIFYNPVYTHFPGGGGYGGGNGGTPKSISSSHATGAGGGGGGGSGSNAGNSYFGGNGGYSVYNNGTITNFTNGQGGTNYIYGPCFYAGNAPTNYYINIQSTSRYGQLFCTGWASTSGTINFNIDTTSTISSSATLYYVLVGVTPTQLSGRSVGSLYGYLWTLTAVAAGSSIFGVYAYHLNITVYQIFNRSNLLSTNALNTSYYRHVALTISGNTHTLYLDGSVVADNSNGLNVFQYYPSTISKLLIGSAADLSYGYSGYIDDFKIWNRALPASDISALYSSFTPSVPQNLTLIGTTYYSADISFSMTSLTNNINYSVVLSPSANTIVTGNNTFLDISGLASNTTYNLNVVASNNNASSTSSSFSFKTNIFVKQYTYSNANLTTNGIYTILTYTTIGTFTLIFTNISVKIGYLVVGGGGNSSGGNNNAGNSIGSYGGAGGGISYSNYTNSNITLNQGTIYNINVGSGGGTSSISDNNNNNLIYSTAGGYGNLLNSGTSSGGTGYLGVNNIQGASNGTGTTGSGTSVNISDININRNYGAAGSSGSNGQANQNVIYASNGNGGGSTNDQNGSATPNTGGGAGGRNWNRTDGGVGGSGIVIIYFLT